MKVYRVYQHYHYEDGSKSGTIEYGIFSDKNKVKEYLKELYEMIKKRKDVEDVILDIEKCRVEYLEEGEFYYNIIKTEAYELDVKLKEDKVGYT